MFHNVQGQYTQCPATSHKATYTNCRASLYFTLSDAKFLYDTLLVHLAQTTESYKANQSRKPKKVTCLCRFSPFIENLNANVIRDRIEFRLLNLILVLIRKLSIITCTP